MRKNDIAYLIFPDRFARDDDWESRTVTANESINQKRSDSVRFTEDDWYRPAYYVREGGEVTGWPFYGGSFRGIESKLSYLSSLGVTCIYMTPVFEAASNHRYDADDCSLIDPALGTDDDFRSLCSSAREAGIRIIIEGDFAGHGGEGAAEKWLEMGASACIPPGRADHSVYDILLDYINYTIDPREAGERLASMSESRAGMDIPGALNITGSPDRARILTLMAAEEDYSSAEKKVKMLSALSYALPGVPCIYYGDEAGLQGWADPENRSAFPWGREDSDLEYNFRMLGLIYDQHPALADGSFEMLPVEESDVLAFIRRGRDSAGTEETLLVLANRSYGDTYIDLSLHPELAACPQEGGEQSDGSYPYTYALELLTSKEIPIDKEHGLGTVRMDRLSARIISLREKAPSCDEIERSAGVIAHVSSIPGSKLGSPAREFVDYIASAGFKVWQVLPLNPAGKGASPYSSHAAFAGDPRFINKDELPGMEGYEAFVRANSYWLYDYLAYMVTQESEGGTPWTEWPSDLRSADPSDVLFSFNRDQQKRANELCKEQYYFAAQWNDLRRYANSKGISIMGDLPMFMSEDSADVWANQDIFILDENGHLRVHAGVPPDAFSGEGQDWGNPLYDWDKLADKGFDWWLMRMRQCAERFDILRIDHFRGFSEYFAIPRGGSPMSGVWQHGPGIGFISKIREALAGEGHALKLIAEDLGYLDAGVMDLLKLSGFPGMEIWQFSADEMMEMAENEPERAERRVFYTGTHDNDTLVGFLTAGSGCGDAGRVGAEIEAYNIIRKIYESPSCLAMIQLQDIFMLGSEARMNVPGVAEGNWGWHVEGDSMQKAYPDAAKRAVWLRCLAEETGRK